MDNRPIGVLDSGVGGLTAVRTLRTLAPNESIIYFGDTARVPYGNRSREDITALSLQDVRFLCRYDLKAVLVACNTITAAAIDALQTAHPTLPIVGTIDPSAEAAAQITRNGRIGIIGTKATVQSGIYAQILHQIAPDATLISRACPRLVPLIESARTSPDDPELADAVAEYLLPIKTTAVDTLLLGCTHYPLIMNAIRSYMGPDVALVDSGHESAVTLLRLLAENNETAGPSAVRKAAYYCSARPDEFEKIAAVFLEEDVSGQVRQVDIALEESKDYDPEVCP